MIKALIGVSLLFSGTAAAGAVGPQIAYTTVGTQTTITLVDPDGSRRRVLYKSPSRMRIFVLDIKPGGGELAFEEVKSTGGNATLKVLRYDDAGTLLATKTLPVCRIGSLDYHPSGSDLLYLDSCGGIRRLNTETMTSTALAGPPGINKVGWRSATELLYNRSTTAASEMLVAPLSAPANVQVVGQVRLASSMDVSTDGTSVLVDPVDFGAISLFNMATGTEQKDWQIGHYGRFSPDGVKVAYVSGYDVRGGYIFIRRTDGAGAAFRLAGKGAFGALDWRN